MKIAVFMWGDVHSTEMKRWKAGQKIVKTLENYMSMPYRMEIVEDRDEGGFVVSFPDLPGCITCGETMESAMANAVDAKRAWLEAALDEGLAIKVY